MGNLIVRQWINVTAFRALNNDLPSTPLKANRQFTARKSITIVVIRYGSLRMTVSLMVHSGITLSPMNPKRGEVVRVKFARLRVVFW